MSERIIRPPAKQKCEPSTTFLCVCGDLIQEALLPGDPIGNGCQTSPLSIMELSLATPAPLRSRLLEEFGVSVLGSTHPSARPLAFFKKGK